MSTGPRSVHMLCLFVASSLMLGCSEEPAPEAPHIAGIYNLVANVDEHEGSCTDPLAVVSFMDETPTGIPVMRADIAQEGDALTATLDPSGCEWTGLVDPAHSFTLSGPCNNADGDRIGHIAATAEAFGSSWTIDGTLRIEFGPDADGTFPCTGMFSLTGSALE